jgi:protein-disulfide isomerase
LKKNTAAKMSYKEQRKLEAERQKKTTRTLIWITGIFVVAIIAAVIIFQPKEAPVEIAYETMPRLGDANAPVKIVELGDYKCPSCKYFSQQIEPQLKQEYIDKGIASFYFSNFAFIGPDSITAALAGQAVFHQNNDAYWKFYDALYKNQGDEKVQWATPQFLVDLAKKENLPIDYDKLMQDITTKKYMNEVEDQIAFARKTQVNSTPTLFINGKKLDNSMDYNAIKAAVEQARKGE